tara:strand:- start:175 stop:417 length:243 start_codon:yes stop_codon:yes gene_type:complete
MLAERNQWLDQVAKTCSATLSILHKKAQSEGHISDADQMMSDVCMAYLYLLSVCDAEGTLTDTDVPFISALTNKLNTTIH